jgi:uncharacterized protein YgiM (DUF1202 family)
MRKPAAPVWIVALALVVAGCGDDDTVFDDATSTRPVETDAPATTSAPPTGSSTPAGAITAATYPFETHPVPATVRCVTGHLSDDALNVRSGPSTDHSVISTLAHDATGFLATGVGAHDGADREWVEVVADGQPGWVAGWFITPNECTTSGVVAFCVIDTACDDRLNVRLGPSGDAEKIGSLAHDAVGVAGTGWVSTDREGRTWVQIEWGSGVGWVAGWFLTSVPCSASAGLPCSCPADGPYSVLIHAVDVPGRMLDFDLATWVWTGPADTEGFWENPDTTVLHLPVADGVDVMACADTDPFDMLYCEPWQHVPYDLGDLSSWIAGNVEIGQNRRFLAEIPGHTGQLWLIELTSCSVTDISGRWVP